jgi:NADH-quinone oxidoreductase subunit L
MTTAYMTRATYLTFFGQPRGAAAGIHHDEHDPLAHAPDEFEEQELVHATAGAEALGETAADAGHTTTSGHVDDHSTAHDTGHDDHSAHHGWVFPFAKSDSPWQITAPIIILAILAFGAGYLNAPALGIHWFEHQTESSIGLPIAHGEEHGGEEEDEGHEEEAGAVTEFAAGAGPFLTAESGDDGHAEASGPFAVPEPPVFTWRAAAPGLILVLLGFLISLGLSLAIWGGRKNLLSPFVGLTTRSKPIGAVHTFLVNKLYLDDLYGYIVWAFGYPIAKATYWFDQHFIDGVVNAAGRDARRAGTWVYRNVDQRVVDGAVDATGTVANESGEALQPIQSGKVNQYGALLFGAATVGAIVLILTNV